MASLNATLVSGALASVSFDALKAASQAATVEFRRLGSSLRGLIGEAAVLKTRAFDALGKAMNMLRVRLAFAAYNVERRGSQRSEGRAALRAQGKRLQEKADTPFAQSAKRIGENLKMPLVGGLSQATSYETEVAALRSKGLSDKVVSEALKFSNSLQIPGVSNLKKLTLLRGAMDELGNIDLAKKALPGLVQRSASDTQTIEGKTQIVQAKFQDAELKLGLQLLPLMTKALDLASGALDRFNAFADRNPVIVKALVVGLGLVAGVLSTLAPMLMTVGFAVQGFSYVLGPLLGTLSILKSMFALLRTALGGVGQAVLWLGRLLLTNPIGLAVSAIALAGYLIIKNWDAVRDFMSTLWEDIKQIFSSAWTIIVGIFTLNGDRIREGWNALWDGISNYTEHVFDGIRGAARAGLNWIMNKLEWVSKTFTRIKKFLTFDSTITEATEIKWNIGELDESSEVSPSPFVDFDSTSPIKFYSGARDEEPPHPPGPLSKVLLPDTSMRGGGMTQNNTFNITQRPGESAEQLARRTAALTRQTWQELSSNSLYDSAAVMS